MIFYNSKQKIIKCECDCWCGEEITLKKLDDEYYLTLSTLQFYAKQNGVLKTILHRIKTAFMILRGKEYRLTEIVLTKEDIQQLKKYISQI